MKIFMNRKVYVSKKDIKNLWYAQVPIPDEVIDIIEEKGIDYLDNNAYDYDFIELESDEAVSYFKDVPFIVNFNKYKKASIKEIVIEASKIAQNKFDLESRINKISDKEDIYMNMLSEMHFCDYILEQYKDIILYKRGELKLDLPKKEKPSPYDNYPTFIENIFTKTI
ncbi:MAG: hypothetical protein IJ565_05695 [Bacilli bacterium]|nr:hypothetical protein [Bacilli bacterium]